MKKILLAGFFCLIIAGTTGLTFKLLKNKNINKAAMASAQVKPQNIDSNLTINNYSPTDTFGFFKDYSSWTSSKRLTDNDGLRWIIEMMVISKTDIQETFLTASQFIDLNGDGLNDYLYFYYRPNMSGVAERGYIALQNDGNNNFDLIYKCFWSKDNTVNIVYGDCADTSYDPAYYENMPFVKTYFPSKKLIYNLYDLISQYGDSQSGANKLNEQNDRYFYDGRFEPSFFMNHRKWKNSTTAIIDNRLKLLTSFSAVGWPGAQPGYNYSQRSSQFTDINDDGLIDILSSYVNSGLYNYCTDRPENITENVMLLNQGDFKFTPIYKCYQGDRCNPLGPYYGDCAAG